MGNPESHEAAGASASTGRGERRQVFALSSSATTAVEDLDVDAVLEERGCKTAFDAVQECMAETNRDWAKCQPLVQEWKACFAKEKNNK